MPLAGFAQQIFRGNLAIRKHQRAGRGAANPQLVFLRANAESGGAGSIKKRGKLLAINFREHGKQVGDAGIGGPHLLSVQYVMLSICRERGPSANVHCIGTGGCLRKGVGRDPLARSQPGEIFFLLLAVCHTR